jgi:hypothetical protein
MNNAFIINLGLLKGPWAARKGVNRRRAGVTGEAKPALASRRHPSQLARDDTRAFRPDAPQLLIVLTHLSLPH